SSTTGTSRRSGHSTCAASTIASTRLATRTDTTSSPDRTGHCRRAIPLSVRWMSPRLVTGRVVVPEPADSSEMLVAVTLGLLAPWSRPWPGGSVWRRRFGGVPFLLELAEMPHRQGDRPGDDEDPDDHESGLVEAEVSH